jgi:hypothetical protein
MKQTLFALIALAALAGCDTLKLGKQIENDLSCSLGDPVAWVVSKWGPIAFASEINPRASARVCPLPAAASVAK